jgi:glyoxylase-like metal-dependent hydrolase (beta-lactamase superfamily II)
MAEYFEVFAIKYATHMRTAELNFADPSDFHEGPLPIDYYVWVVRSPSRTYVVDTGFNAATAAERGRELIRCPAEGLKLVGVDTGDVKDVIITHLHYDHVGNFDLFPNANFHLQDNEMTFATGRHMQDDAHRAPMDVEHVVGMVRMVYGDRVVFHDGDTELAPGISLHLIGGHTAGLQVVRVNTRRGWIVLASDASHLYANMETGNSYPIIFREDEMLAGYKTLNALAESAEHIVPGHDPLVMDRYPSPSPDLDGIVVRLD